MNWVSLVPSWVWWLLAVLVVGGAQQARVVLIKGDLADARTDLADYRVEVAERDRRATLEALRESKRRLAAIDEVTRDATEKLESARADADRAGDALGRLQQQYADLERRSRVCGNTITAQLSEAAETAARMRADMFGRIGEAARLYAAEADRRGVAGAACERAYDSLSR